MTDPAADALAGEIHRAKEVLARIVARKGHRVLDLVLFRFLKGAVDTAEALLVLGKAGHTAGTGPLVRHLFESTVDLHYLVTSEDPDWMAARVLAWDILDWDRLWRKHDAVADADPSLEAGVQEESPDEAAQKLADQLRSVGEDPRAFEEAYEEGRRGHRPWHWSGTSSMARRIKELQERESGAQKLLAMYRALWPRHSGTAHPPVSPLGMSVDVEGNISVPPEDPGRAASVLRNAKGYLEMIRGLVEGGRAG